MNDNLTQDEWRIIHNALSEAQAKGYHDAVYREKLQRVMDKVRDNYIQPTCSHAVCEEANRMTIQELITRLQKQPQDLTICIEYADGHLQPIDVVTESYYDEDIAVIKVQE